MSARSLLPRTLLALGIAFAWGSASIAAPILLYSIDFEMQTVGAVVAEDQGPFPRSSVSSCFSCVPFQSNPLISDSLIHLDGHALELRVDENPAIANEQVLLDVPSQYSFYQVEVDLQNSLVEVLGGNSTFTVFFDAPTILPLRFLTQALLVLPHSPAQSLASQGRLHLVMNVDFEAQRWTVSVGNVQGSGFLDPGFYSELRSVRLALTGGSLESRVGIDNLRLWAIPEPIRLLELALAVLALRGGCRMSPKSSSGR
ncbi:MAG: hypothetical protein CL910_06135 [Deltaproteobacteria bacterium]|jgi:hypothetical protein|nr:hypothetical protein [Deltaproteobacteria bacterium]